MQEDSGGACEVHAFRSGRRLRIVARVPLPKTTQPPARIQIQAIEPIVDCGRYAVKRTVGDRVDVYATVFKDGHDTLAGAVRVRGARRAQLGARCRCTPSATTAGAGRSPSTVRAGGSSRSPRGPIASPRGRRRSAARSERARRSSRASCPRVRCCSAAIPSPSRRGSPRRRATATASSPRRRSRSTSTACSRASARGTSSSRARGAASAAWRTVLPQLAQLGFDVVYLPPVHPIGHTNRKGPNNTLTPGPGDPGSPWAIGAEEGGHDAIHPDLGTWDDFDAMVAAAKAAGVELALDFAMQCSPDHPWLKAASGVVQPPPRRDAEVRREPAEEVPGHLQRQLRLRGLARRSGRRCSTSCSAGSSAGSPSSASTTRTRSRLPFWEWLIREVRASASRGDLPRRGVHAARR